jgi:hypothetical protein
MKWKNFTHISKYVCMRWKMQHRHPLFSPTGKRNLPKSPEKSAFMLAYREFL